MGLEDEVRVPTAAQDNADTESPPEGFFNKAWFFLSSLTIEPMMMLWALAGSMISVPQDQMLLYKICVEHLGEISNVNYSSTFDMNSTNITSAFCSKIEEFTWSTEYHEIEAEFVDFKAIQSLAEHVIPIFLSFFLGSWSDSLGRKPFLYFCMTGSLVSSALNLANAFFLDEWSRWVWLFTVPLSMNMVGGTLAMIMVTYSFISDNSTDKQRTIRMGVLSFSWHVASPAAGPLGAWLYDSGGYVCVFSASTCLIFLCWFLLLLRLWNFKEKTTGKKLSFLDMVSPRHVIESVKVTIRKRPGHKRTYLLIMMFTMLMNMMPYIGDSTFQFTYLKSIFMWGVSDYTWYRTTCTLVSSLAMAVLFPLFHRLHTTDNSIIMLSCVSQIMAGVLRGFSTRPWQFYLSAFVDMGTSLISPPIRAQLSHCVEPHELGKVFAMLASVESVVPILGSQIYSKLYNATKQSSYPWPGSCYFATCGFVLLGLLVTLGVAASLDWGHIGGAQRKLARANSNRHPEDIRPKEEELICTGLKYRPGGW